VIARTLDGAQRYTARVRDLVASSPKKERPFYSGYVIRTLGAAIAVLVAPSRATPNTISVAGLVVHAVAATILVTAPTPIPVVAWLSVVVLWQLAFGLDAADGQLARLRGQSSAFGAWLDMSIDVVTHVLVYGAQAVVIAQALALSGPQAAGLTAIVLGCHLFQLFVGWQHGTVRSGPAITDPPRWLVVAMRAQHALDYGWFLLITAVLLPWPMLLAAYLLLSSTIHFLAAIAQLGMNWHRYLRDSRESSGR
jgi:phosphatidylglycerophosphate synthase